MTQKNILIVDDDHDIRQIVRLTLEVEGYATTEARNGEEAVKLAIDGNPDLILLDIVMPGIEGGEVVSLLKEDPHAKSIPIIFLTGMLDRSDSRNAPLNVKVGKEYYYAVAKPFDSSDLINAINRVFGEKIPLPLWD